MNQMLNMDSLRIDKPTKSEFTKGEHYDFIPILAYVGIRKTYVEEDEDEFFDGHFVVGAWIMNHGYDISYARVGANEHGVEYEVISWIELPQ